MGSVAALAPFTIEAVNWLRAECESEPWQWITMGGLPALVVEPDCADEILAAWEAR